MNVTPQGSISQVLYGAAVTIAHTDEFQARTGLDRQRALDRVYFGFVEGEPEQLKSLRPFAMVMLDGHGYMQIAEGAQIELGAEGGVVVVLQDNVREPNHADALFDFCNFVGLVMDQAALLSGRDYDQGQRCHWPFRKATLLTSPVRTSFDNRQAEDFYTAVFSLTHKV